MKTVIFLILYFSCFSLGAQMPSGEEIMTKIDENLSSENRIFQSTMIIHGRRNVRTVKSKTWTTGETRSFTEYLFPVREKDTKMLKLEDQLWIYSPATDRTIQIAGHMLRQSVMGSDMSYEDLMEDKKLSSHYHAKTEGSESIDENDCWVVELTAINDDVTYYKKRLWVDKQKFIPLKEELYAKSGTLLKRTELSKIEKIEGRWFPKQIVFKDMLKEGDGTQFIVDEIEFNVEIPDYLFSKASLKK